MDGGGSQVNSSLDTLGSTSGSGSHALDMDVQHIQALIEANNAEDSFRAYAAGTAGAAAASSSSSSAPASVAPAAISPPLNSPKSQQQHQHQQHATQQQQQDGSYMDVPVKHYNGSRSQHSPQRMHPYQRAVGSPVEVTSGVGGLVLRNPADITLNEYNRSEGSSAEELLRRTPLKIRAPEMLTAPTSYGLGEFRTENRVFVKNKY